jgi:hypothetical protein
MNFKRVLLFAVVFISLAAIYFFMETSVGKRNKKEGPKLLFPELKIKKAALIKIKSTEKGEFVLTKAKDVWQVKQNSQTYIASTDAVEKLLDKVAKMKIETVSSRNPKNFAAFEVSNGKGIETTILDSKNNSLAALVVGKSGPDLFSTYVRNKASNNVILTTGMLKTDFGRELSDWRNKKIYSLKPSDITEYRVTDNMTTRFKKENDIWQAVKPELPDVNQETVKEAINKFADLEAAGFVYDNNTNYGFNKPQKIITATLVDKNSQTLIIGKDKNAFQYFAKKKGGDTIYIIEKHVINIICPSLESLKLETKPSDRSKTAEKVK